MPKKSDDSRERETPPFEAAMARLEQIVAAMEGEQLPLEELLVRYEEGVRLIKVCGDKLADAERRIELVSRNAGGDPELRPFQPADEPKPADPPARAPKPADDPGLF